MRFKHCVAAMLAAAMPLNHALAETSGTAAAEPAGPAADSPEDIARDAARDLKDSRFYNRPGATRAQYDADWQECRLIARGSRTPSGMVPVYYNPAVISPLAAGAGGAIGGIIAGAIAEGQQRRANRRNCLLIRGWRLVEVPPAEAARVSQMTDEQRSAYFDTIVGAEHVMGSITERTSFSLAHDPALRLDAPLPRPGSVYFGRRADPAVPFALAPGEGAVVIAYRRPDGGSAGRSGTIDFARYDLAARDLVYQPRDWRRRGDNTTYRMSAASSDRRAPYEVQVMRVTPGDYVVTGHSVGRLPITTSYCFGAPTFHVGEGEVVYVGDFVPYMDAELSNGESFFGIAWTSNIEDARRTLAQSHAALATALQPASLHNRASYACSAITMDRWDLPGVEPLPEPEVRAAAGAPPAEPQ
ncbi:MAG TPA: hypothetical protein VEW04_04755 [Allosphingosinicella sp.]|nr:hypothetical protein [Allosphingosinicella sp.]